MFVNAGIAETRYNLSFFCCSRHPCKLYESFYLIEKKNFPLTDSFPELNANEALFKQVKCGNSKICVIKESCLVDRPTALASYNDPYS